MALQSPDIEIIGITTVSGNITARAAALNTLWILRVMGKESKIPVLKGESRPLSKKIGHAVEVRGKKGLGNITLQCNPALLQEKDVSDFISEILANYRRGEVALVATGPLTNVESVILEDPEITHSLSRICIMGGAFWACKQSLWQYYTTCRIQLLLRSKSCSNSDDSRFLWSSAAKNCGLGCN
jgi:purine nucleosidase